MNMPPVFGPARDSLQYGGDVFGAASAFLRRAVPGVGGDDGDGSRARIPKGVPATALLLTGLPTLTVRLSSSPPGERLRLHFGHRQWGILHSRLAQGVLGLPETPGRYLRGRSRQALRTNIHKAHAAGISCERLDPLGARRAATLQLRERVADRVQWPDEQFRLPGDVWWSAHDRRGDAVALAQVTVDREWALLQSFVSIHRPSRYLLHHAIVEALVAARVRYLAVNTSMAPLLEPTLQYWQRLLGFQVVNLSVSSAPLAVDGPPPIADLAIDREVDPDAHAQEAPEALSPVPALAP
jgi:hypothetical protein